MMPIEFHIKSIASSFYFKYLKNNIKGAVMKIILHPESKFKFSFNALNYLTLETSGESRENVFQYNSSSL